MERLEYFRQRNRKLTSGIVALRFRETWFQIENHGKTWCGHIDISCTAGLGSSFEIQKRSSAIISVSLLFLFLCIVFLAVLLGTLFSVN